MFFHHAIAVGATTSALAAATPMGLSRSLDYAMIGLGICLATGRVGCLMVGCCHGRPARVGIVYGPEHIEPRLPAPVPGTKLVPVQLVEAAVVAAVTAAAVAVVVGPRPARRRGAGVDGVVRRGTVPARVPPRRARPARRALGLDARPVDGGRDPGGDHGGRQAPGRGRCARLGQRRRGRDDRGSACAASPRSAPRRLARHGVPQRRRLKHHAVPAVPREVDHHDRRRRHAEANNAQSPPRRRRHRRSRPRGRATRSVCASTTSPLVVPCQFPIRAGSVACFGPTSVVGSSVSSCCITTSLPTWRRPADRPSSLPPTWPSPVRSAHGDPSPSVSSSTPNPASTAKPGDGSPPRFNNPSDNLALLRSVDPELLPEKALQRFAGGIAGDDVDEHDSSGHLVSGQFAAAVIKDAALVQSGFGTDDHRQRDARTAPTESRSRPRRRRQGGREGRLRSRPGRRSRLPR